MITLKLVIIVLWLKIVILVGKTFMYWCVGVYACVCVLI